LYKENKIERKRKMLKKLLIILAIIITILACGGGDKEGNDAVHLEECDGCALEGPSRSIHQATEEAE
jgi:hypothetical protein